MFFYQGIIMLLTAVLIYILAMLLRHRNRKVLVVLIVLILIAGGAGVYSVMYYFGNHFYTQNVNTATLSEMSISNDRNVDIKKMFPDYNSITPSKYAKDAVALGKTYDINTSEGHSTIKVSIYSFNSQKKADSYFQSTQKFYENKSYIPLDGAVSKKAGTKEPRYLVSFIESQYKDYSDFIYLPSKITYASDVVVQSGDIVIEITESANKPVTNKESVINTIKDKIKQK